MKKSLLIIVIIFAFSNFIFSLPANAQGRKDASLAATKQEAQLTNTKTRANKLIENRIASLNRLLARIQNDKKLSDNEKSSLSADVQNAIAGLQALKAKIEADTNTTDVKADAKKIIDYKVYSFLEPKIRLLLTIDNLETLSQNVADISSRLQTLIDDLKSQGKDTTVLQTLLTDINTRLSDINSRLSSDKQKVLAVSVSSANQQTFVEVRQDLAKVRADFARIRNDIAQMRNTFRISLKNLTVTPRVTTP